MGRHQKRADSKLEELEGKHAEHLRLRGEWAAELALLREGKAQAEMELQESREREAAARQAAVEAAAALEEQAGDAAALEALHAALRRELTEVEARYFGLAVELKNQDADIRRTKRACLDKYSDLPTGGCNDGLPNLPRTPKEGTLSRSEVAKDECTPLGTAPLLTSLLSAGPSHLLSAARRAGVRPRPPSLRVAPVVPAVPTAPAVSGGAVTATQASRPKLRPRWRSLTGAASPSRPRSRRRYRRSPQSRALSAPPPRARSETAWSCCGPCKSPPSPSLPRGSPCAFLSLPECGVKMYLLCILCDGSRRAGASSLPVTGALICSGTRL